MWKRDSRYMQYLSAITATFSAACHSMHTTWSSPVIPKIVRGQTPISATTSQEDISWMVTSCNLGAVPGTLISGWLMDKFGKQRTLLAAGVLLFIPWLILAFTTSIWIMFLARFVAGVGMAATANILPMYNGEIAEKDIRGKLGSTMNVLTILGNIFIFAVGPYVSYLVLCIACSIFPLIFIGTFYFMPESPYFLVKVARYEDAAASLKRLMGQRTDASYRAHLDEIKKEIQEQSAKKVTTWEFFSKQDYRRPLIIGFGIRTLTVLSGIPAITAYTQTIIDSTQSNISSEVSSVILGVIQLPMALITAFLVDKIGRKPLLIFSCLGSAIALVGEGIYFYMQDALETDVDDVSWLPSTALILYYIMRSLGISTVSNVVIGEVFATNIKRHVVTVGGLYTTLLSFAVTKYFHAASTYFGRYTTFWFFALSCIAGALFVVFVVPETSNKTFLEIQEEMQCTKKKSKNANSEGSGSV